MRWKRRGRIWRPSGELPWARGHALLPTPLVLGDRVRVFVASTDSEMYGRLGWVDVALDDPSRVLGEAGRPALDLGEPGAFDDAGVTPSCALEVDGRVWLYYVGWQRGVRTPYALYTGLAVSDDGGERFERVSRAPVLDRTDAEPFSRGAAFVLPDGDGYRAWYWSCRAWTTTSGWTHYNNVIRSARSPDGRRWVADEGVLLAPRDPAVFSLGRPWVARMEDGWHMWFTIRAHGRPDLMGHAVSDDGERWRRVDPEGTLSPAPAGWDSEMLCYPVVVRAGGRVVMFYNGNGHGRTGFGWAELA